MPLLEIEGIGKSYPGVRALGDVDLAVETGEVHALLGENGAGKSTLMKVISGSVVPDAGRIALNGEAMPFGDPEAARARGIAIVYQELSLIPALTVGENVVLGRWPGRGWGTVDWDRVFEGSRRHIDRVGLKVDPRQEARELGMGERQLVEIAKALSGEARLLLLDEPTSALSDPEADRLFAIIRDLRSSGVAIVYVTHRLPEALQIADRISVLRDGELVGTVDAGQVSEAELARMMVGRLVDTAPVRLGKREGPGDGEVALRTRGLARLPRLKPVDLELRVGEVVGVFGLMGSGRTRLARCLFGLEPATGGALEVFGRRVGLHSPVEAISRGIGYLGEDRSVGIVPRMSVTANVTLGSLRRLGRGPLIDFTQERRVAGGYVKELAIRTSSLDRLAETLSGGNQQKLVLARWLCSNARILILDDPTRGIDVGAKEEVFRLVRDLAGEGVAVLYLTSEIKEARGLADRVLIMADGRIVASVDPEAPEEEIMAMAGGVHG